jgi:hypothetical protein
MLASQQYGDYCCLHAHVHVQLCECIYVCFLVHKYVQIYTYARIYRNLSAILHFFWGKKTLLLGMSAMAWPRMVFKRYNKNIFMHTSSGYPHLVANDAHLQLYSSFGSVHLRTQRICSVHLYYLTLWHIQTHTHTHTLSPYMEIKDSWQALPYKQTRAGRRCRETRYFHTLIPNTSIR